MSPSHNNKKHFRTDIEGLRAIAVLLVIGSHYSIPGMTAGFIGVDVFFVISGYLITGLLVREHQSSTHIALSRFYANRFRRLFPALATMLLASSLAVYIFLPALQNLSQSKAALMASIWVSNFYFAFSDSDYFLAETATNAFLHTWSLGVEEQFYLAWPLLILIALRVFPFKTDTNRLWLLFTAIGATSLLACLIMANKTPILAFYLMPTRAWQFAAGAITWLIVQKYPLENARNAATYTGLGLLSLSLILIDQETVYPGYMATMPTLATCAWLWAGSNKSSTLHSLLSLAPLQWIGKLSYSLYLWHWPVLIITDHLINVHGKPLNTALALTLSILLALFTYHTIENPLRYGRAKNLRPALQITLTLSFMFLISSQILNWNIETQESLALEEKYLAAASDAPPIYQDGCDDWYRSDTINPCTYGNPEAKKTAALIGDSIGAQWYTTIENMFDASEWRIIVLTKSSCPMIDEAFFYKRIGREYTECATWRENVIDWVTKEKPAIIFVGNSANLPFNEKQIIDGTNRVLEKLSRGTESIYLIEANPVLLENGPQCLIEKSPAKRDQCVGDDRKNARYKHFSGLLKSIASQHDNTFWIETSSFVCPQGKCKAERNNMVVFRDEQHLTATFAASAAQHFMEQLEKGLPDQEKIYP